ncbi:hypothetical protein [Tengunoibacter tsumagoiensis]|uniref:hypothetical protein n=1 Tax=Tengunoibacter tsumagoiensis TaxID=2014871 RepID=UPI000F847FD2|nr:hypothetical protein [Tengunoibacter tsumagoiensis]
MSAHCFLTGNADRWKHSVLERVFSNTAIGSLLSHGQRRQCAFDWHRRSIILGRGFSLEECSTVFSALEAFGTTYPEKQTCRIIHVTLQHVGTSNYFYLDTAVK